MPTTTAPGTWVVETALKGPGTPAWETRSGYARKESARIEVAQLGTRWRRQGYRVRVRFEADPAAVCNVCGKAANDPYRVWNGDRVRNGCVARIHDAHLSGASLAWAMESGMEHRLTGWNGF